MKRSRVLIVLSMLSVGLYILNLFIPTEDNDKLPDAEGSKNIVAIWISCYEYDFSGMSSEEISKTTDSMFSTLQTDGINTVFFHVRAFGDAIYDSEYYPYSDNILDEEGNTPDCDVMKILIETAHKYGIAIHAWINPYRISLSDDSLPDKYDGTALQGLMQNQENSLIKYNGGLYLNPASSASRHLIVDGVRELVERYDVDGIQFDDYFYPTTDTDFDSQSYEQYQSDGGGLPLDDWRRANVDLLISEVYGTVKAKNKSLLFGVSPSADIDGDYKTMYADVEKWMASSGFVDYICPQIYYGFDNKSFPYEETADRWAKLKRDSSVDLIAGLASYKVGKEDEYAGDGSAKNEWKEHSDILRRQAEYCISGGQYCGIALFSYKNYLSTKNKEERDNLIEYIKSFNR